MPSLALSATKRFTGSFWTPAHRARQALELVDSHLGTTWTDTHVVWDPACGGLNLTRPRTFSKLYASTLNADDLDAAANPEGTLFQFDFLNDPLTDLPAGLTTALRQRHPVVMLANPPYAQATDYDGAQKATVARTRVAHTMVGLGHARSELYTQFYYRAIQIAEHFGYERDFHLVFFSKTGYLTSPSFHAFRQRLTSRFGFRGGFLFNAGDFDGTSRTWGVAVAHWQLGAPARTPAFTLDDGVWEARSVDKNETLTAWLNEIPLDSKPDPAAPLTRNGLDPASPKAPLVMRRGWIGYLHNNGDNVQYSGKYTGLYSMGFGSAHGRDITPANLERATTVFSIRRSVHTDIATRGQLWIRDKDLFRAPADVPADIATNALVYALVDPQSRQTSLRNWHGHPRVRNEFYPFAGPGRDRIVHTLLRQRSLSAQAARVLSVWQDAVAAGIDVADPRLQADNWDAGWRQLSPAVGAQWRRRMADARLELGAHIAEWAYDEKLIAR